MANYRVNEASKTVSVFGELTPAEQSIITAYINAGYKPVVRKKAVAVRITHKDIVAYFSIKQDEENAVIFAKYEEERLQTSPIQAIHFFRDEYYDIYDEIMTKKEKDNVETSIRHAREAVKRAEDALSNAVKEENKAKNNVEIAENEEEKKKFEKALEEAKAKRKEAQAKVAEAKQTLKKRQAVKR
jgi:hypothetical protein